MDGFDKELASIEVAVKTDGSYAIRKRFENSEEWNRHKQWHEENGGTPVLRIWDDAPAPVAKVEAEIQEVQHRRAIKVGGCDCQPRFPFMELNDKGDVQTAGITPPEAAGTVYGTISGGTTSSYGVSGPTENVYNSGPNQQKDLYR